MPTANQNIIRKSGSVKLFAVNVNSWIQLSKSLKFRERERERGDRIIVNCFVLSFFVVAFGSLATVLFCHFVVMSFGSLATVLFCHFVVLSFGSLSTVCCFVILCCCILFMSVFEVLEHYSINVESTYLLTRNYLF